MFWNIPNTLTISRVVLIPVVLTLYILNHNLAAFILLLWSVLTDFFDGYLARRLNQTTDIGALLDPIADKMISLSYYSLIGFLGLAPLSFVVIVLFRNFCQIMSVPILIFWLRREFKVKPKRFPKWATAISDIFLFVPLFLPMIFQSSENSAYVYTVNLAMMIIALMEIKILFDYLPRLYQIAIGTHDTFE